MQENGTELLVCCTGCQSCMPCMVKINIPGLFALYNRTATEGVEAVRAEYERQLPETRSKERFSMAKTHIIAVAGKGGVGKTTTCGMIIDYLCKQKKGPILVVDADANSNLNEVLGVEVETTLGDIREEMAHAEQTGTVPANMTKADYAEMKFNSALIEEDDYDMLVMGRTQGKGCYCFVNGVLKTQIDKYVGNYRYMVVDNEAGLEHISREELAGMFYENSDEPYSDEIAKAITEYIRRGNHVDTTTKLRQIIEETLSFLPEKDRKDTVKKTCQRVFQALRIDVNNEFEVLYEFMEKLPDALKPGGRVAILTFHSGEDKLVKKALKAGYKAGIYSDYAKDVIRPSAQECAQNGRARSTKMRWAVKSEY